MRIWHILAGAMVAGALIDGASADPLPMDAPVQLGNVETVCTGIGSGKDDPRWAAYPIRVEFSNAGAQYLSGAHVKLSDVARKTLAEFDCSGSWVLFKLPRGKYTVSASITGENLGTHSANFEPPTTGQKRVEIQFGAMPANK